MTETRSHFSFSRTRTSQSCRDRQTETACYLVELGQADSPDSRTKMTSTWGRRTIHETEEKRGKGRSEEEAINLVSSFQGASGFSLMLLCFAQLVPEPIGETPEQGAACTPLPRSSSAPEGRPMPRLPEQSSLGPTALPSSGAVTRSAQQTRAHGPTEEVPGWAPALGRNSPTHHTSLPKEPPVMPTAHPQQLLRGKGH